MTDRVAPLKGLYTIPPGRGFLKDLARGLSDIYPTQTLGQARVFLPTRRACRDFTQAFAAISDAAGLLPAAYPMGDIDEDDLGFEAESFTGAAMETALNLPPALSATRRTFMLATLSQAKERAEHGASMPLPAALRLGRELGRFLDDLAIDRVNADDVRTINAGEFAEHWQRVLTFLDIVLKAWPEELQDIDRMDPVARHEALAVAQAEAWRATPPTHPTIIAGSTGAQPATRDLMAALIAGPNGAVVLPGFDNTVNAEGFQNILNAPSHPQHAMAVTLDTLGLTPSDVKTWPDANDPTRTGAPAILERVTLAREAMRPASEADQWTAILPGQFQQAVNGLQRIDAANPDEEARVAAIFLREQLEILATGNTGSPASLASPARRVALVTPDRGLARRVAAELRRWNIDADDSAGQPLGEAPLGAYLRLVARAFRPNASTTDLLALLKHPYASGGKRPTHFRAQARAIELAIWRDDRRQRQARTLPETAAMLTGLKHAPPELAGFAGKLSTLAAPFALILAKGDALRPMLEAHIRLAEALATTDDETGPERLWRNEAGESAASVLAEALDAASASPALIGADYPETFDALIDGATVRNNRSIGAPVQIMGVLEARFTQFDAIVLGGLDEGVWPRPPSADPWFSRGMRGQIGLSDPEKRIGLSAHDFTQLLYSPAVLLTRSRMRDDAPTKPSRWLVRLDAVLAADGETPSLAQGQERYRYLAGALDPKADTPNALPPAPRPTASQRPRTLSATEIETLILDPYAIYAKHVLGLHALASLDPAPSPADRGRIIHEAFERFLKANPTKLPANVLKALLDAGDIAFAAFGDHAEAQAFWRPAFERSARWAAVEEQTHRSRIGLSHAYAELSGSVEFQTPYKPLLLRARADRIDVGEGDALAIIDYKTGAPPSKIAIASADAPQLPLEAAIAKFGSFMARDEADAAVTLSAKNTTLLAIWQLAGRDGGKITAIAGDAAEAAMATAWDGVQRLIAAFDNPDTPYLSAPRTAFGEAPAFSNYRALARLSDDVEER